MIEALLTQKEASMRRSAGFLVPLLVLVLAGCGAPAAPAQPTAAPLAQPTSAAPAQPTAAPPAQPTTAPTEVQAEATAAPAQGKAITIQMGANDPRSIDPQRAIDTR